MANEPCDAGTGAAPTAFERFHTHVLPSHGDILDIIRYAAWARAGAGFIAKTGGPPVSWEEFDRHFSSSGEKVRILEIGCGSGYVGKMLAEAGARVVGLDPALAPGHPDRPPIIHSHPDLTLLALGLEGIQDIGHELSRARRSVGRRMGRAKASAEKAVREGLADVELVLCAWMDFGINLTPAIRLLGAPAIFYIKSGMGATGLDFGQYGSIIGIGERELRESGMEPDLRSFMPSRRYEDHHEYPLQGMSCAILGTGILGHVQFRKGLAHPDFEFHGKGSRMGSGIEEVDLRGAGICRKEEGFPYDILYYRNRDGWMGQERHYQLISEKDRTARPLMEGEARRVARMISQRMAGRRQEPGKLPAPARRRLG